MGKCSKPTVYCREKERFDRSLKMFEQMQKWCRREKSPVKKMIQMMRVNQNVKNFYKRHGNKEFTFDIYPDKREKERVGKTVLREVMTNYADDLLCVTGKDLDVMVKEYGIDPTLPIKQKQESVYLAALNRLEHGKSKKINMTKQRREG